MRFSAPFVKSILLVEGASLAGLLLAGLVLTVCQGDPYYGRTFFSYRIELLDRTPAWFAVASLLFAINGFWLFRLALLEGGVGTPPDGPWGQYNIAVPVNHLRLFAINLIAIPALIWVFILVRALDL